MTGNHDHHGHDHEHGEHGHDHHGHGHGGLGHVHAPANFGKAFVIGIGLNLAFVVAEVVFGLLGHSVALLADAGHNMSDVLGLGVAWAATVLARRAPTARFTYGLGSSSILAALFNAVFLLVVVGGLSWEAIQRLVEPEPVAGKTVMAVAAIGIVLNGVCAWLFASGRKGDLNVRGAFMHMAADALVSAGVVVAGLVILLTGWTWLDPAVTLAINAVIVWGTWGLLTGSLSMSLDAVPPGIELARVRSFLEGQPGVAGLHDLHVWSISTTDVAMTAHVLMPGGHPGDAFLLRTAADLKERFGIGHATLQVETDASTPCVLAPDHVV
ncbi:MULTISPECIES: cation diffusion facilitator family transporter [Methylobacterium]|uniref:Cadmium, cobalt and zinc/H(+)-K(+) antiporter n=2 Tax=Methylobacterium TaxID=407 RepID=A0AA37M5K9_9HYPH|nr:MULTISPECIES: cation diffusion facilitator family transporter [Methylobacterium]PIK72346.1 cation transporter [Methylobacterium frigidaeris]TGD97911.1 cation transporter [Methylobacterium nonmethylotrophicum]GJD63415.1 Cadmium, cobalt and zinc/H(+)-K(+) antiporter [Methylobacterium frigidaeris]